MQHIKTFWGTLCFFTLTFFIANVAFPTSVSALSRGASGSDVKTLQVYLIDHHYLVGYLATGYFGAGTEAAVQKLQCALKMVCTGTPATTGWGVYGPKTKALLAGGAAPSPTSASAP